MTGLYFHLCCIFKSYIKHGLAFLRCTGNRTGHGFAFIIIYLKNTTGHGLACITCTGIAAGHSLLFLIICIRARAAKGNIPATLPVRQSCKLYLLITDKADTGIKSQLPMQLSKTVALLTLKSE